MNLAEKHDWVSPDTWMLIILAVFVGLVLLCGVLADIAERRGGGDR